jgi:Zn-dependent dipeptidase, microsomal dipeptidase homolog
MRLIADAHCDTASEALDRNESLYRNSGHIDIERMKLNENHLQFFAAYIDQEKYKDYPIHRLFSILDYIYMQMEEHGSFSICRNYDEIMQAFENNKIASIISIENGSVLQGQLSALRMFYKLGVRSICLTWNYANEIADGVKDARLDRGLTSFGREVVLEMNRLGMLVDVSHLSEKSFWDVMETAKAPLMASHSNSKAYCSHPRNLNNDQLNAIKLNSGFVGINLYPVFLNDSGKASLDDIVRHIEHIVSIVGEDHIGLGTDFDGIESLPEGIGGLQDINRIFERLLALNYSNSFVEKFAGDNLVHIIKQNIG